MIEADGRPPIQGESTVEFRLLYQGILTTSGDVSDKFAIRRQFHPQLRNLCSEHPLLRSQLIAWGHVEAQQTLGDAYTAEHAFSFGIKRLADTHLKGRIARHPTASPRIEICLSQPVAGFIVTREWLLCRRDSLQWKRAYSERACLMTPRSASASLQREKNLSFSFRLSAMLFRSAQARASPRWATMVRGNWVVAVKRHTRPQLG